MDTWPKDLSPAELGEWVMRHCGEDTLMRQLDMSITEVGPERAVVSMQAQPGVYTFNPTRVVHAGAIVSLADTTATFAAMAAYRGDLELDQMPVAVALSTQLVGNVQEGRLVAEATISHPGRTLMVASTRVSDDNGRLLALVNSTHFVRPR